MNKYALIVVTSNDKLGESGEKTGWFLSEVSHVYWPLVNDGFHIDFASPQGGMAPLEESSKILDDEENKKFVEKFKIDNGIKTLPLKDIDPNKYNVIYFAGGHGTMWDFPDQPDINYLTSEIYENGGIVAAVCHGPSALTDVKLSNGQYLIEGKKINSFTDAEEREVGKDYIVPFMLESRLRERGALFESAPNWGNKVVIDGRLLSGQNPQSASSLGEAIVKTFREIQEEHSHVAPEKKMENRPPI